MSAERVVVRRARAGDAAARARLLRDAYVADTTDAFMYFFFHEATLQAVVLAGAGLFIFMGCGLTTLGALPALAAALVWLAARLAHEQAAAAQAARLRTERAGWVAERRGPPRPPGARLELALDDDAAPAPGAALLGTVSLVACRDDAGGWLQGLAVAPGWRRRGLARALEAAARAGARALRYGALRAATSALQPAARAVLHDAGSAHLPCTIVDAGAGGGAGLAAARAGARAFRYGALRAATSALQPAARAVLHDAGSAHLPCTIVDAGAGGGAGLAAARAGARALRYGALRAATSALQPAARAVLHDAGSAHLPCTIVDAGAGGGAGLAAARAGARAFRYGALRAATSALQPAARAVLHDAGSAHLPCTIVDAGAGGGAGLAAARAGARALRYGALRAATSALQPAARAVLHDAGSAHLPCTIVDAGAGGGAGLAAARAGARALRYGALRAATSALQPAARAVLHDAGSAHLPCTIVDAGAGGGAGLAAARAGARALRYGALRAATSALQPAARAVLHDAGSAHLPCTIVDAGAGGGAGLAAARAGARALRYGALRAATSALQPAARAVLHDAGSAHLPCTIVDAGAGGGAGLAAARAGARAFRYGALRAATSALQPAARAVLHDAGSAHLPCTIVDAGAGGGAGLAAARAGARAFRYGALRAATSALQPAARAVLHDAGSAHLPCTIVDAGAGGGAGLAAARAGARALRYGALRAATSALQPAARAVLHDAGSAHLPCTIVDAGAGGGAGLAAARAGARALRYGALRAATSALQPAARAVLHDAGSAHLPCTIVDAGAGGGAGLAAARAGARALRYGALRAATSALQPAARAVLHDAGSAHLPCTIVDAGAGGGAGLAAARAGARALRYGALRAATSALQPAARAVLHDAGSAHLPCTIVDAGAGGGAGLAAARAGARALRYGALRAATSALQPAARAVLHDAGWQCAGAYARPLLGAALTLPLARLERDLVEC